MLRYFHGTTYFLLIPVPVWKQCIPMMSYEKFDLVLRLETYNFMSLYQQYYANFLSVLGSNGMSP